MKLSEVPLNSARKLLTTVGLKIRLGRFNTCLNLPTDSSLLNDFYHLYSDSTLLSESDVIDFSVNLTRTQGIRRIVRQQVNFDFCGIRPFEPLPYNQALPLLEWGLNWCVSQHFHQSLIIHAAVIEKNGKALILPGQPGAGKSTLCAGLVYLGGWRLLSDELTLVDLSTGKILPNPRPISLKNESINVINQQFSHVFKSATVSDTAKGKVALFKPPQNSVAQYDKSIYASHIIFPKYKCGSQLEIAELSKGSAFLQVANQSFNYPVLGKKGFEAVSQLIDQTESLELNYGGDLKQANSVLEQLI